MYVRKEAVLSSRIEGAQSSLQDLLTAEATFVPPPPGEVGPALGALETFLHGQDDLPPLATTFAGANQIVQRLEDLGVLKEITGQARHLRFRYDACVRLFEDEARQ